MCCEIDWQLVNSPKRDLGEFVTVISEARYLDLHLSADDVDDKVGGFCPRVFVNV